MKRSKKMRWLVLLTWTVLTFYLCIQNSDQSSALSSFIAQKLYSPIGQEVDFSQFHNSLREFAHFFAHLVLAFLAYRAIAIDRNRKSVLICFIAVISIAVIDEMVQFLVSTRGVETIDLALNIAGVITGLLIGRLSSKN